MEFNPTYARIENEDCSLYYWYQGTGPLITFIPGGNGHGRQFNNLITLLSDKYTCATFDRRQMSNSQVKVPKMMTYGQQARDVVAVIKTVGFEKSVLFGSSMGGTIAFQVGMDFPEMVDHLISHEGVTPHLLPDAEELRATFLEGLEVFRTEGIHAVMAKFQPTYLGFDEGTPPPLKPEPGNPINQWTYEIPAVIDVQQDLTILVKNGTSVGLKAGKRSRDAWYARNGIYQQEILGCVRMIVPGHHEGFQCEAEEYLPYLFEMLDTLEKRREAKLKDA